MVVVAALAVEQWSGRRVCEKISYKKNDTEERVIPNYRLARENAPLCFPSTLWQSLLMETMFPLGWTAIP